MKQRDERNEISEPINDGGPAVEGMSLRDYFAAKALQGLMSQDDSRLCPKQDPSEEYLQKWRLSLFALDAETCYVMADAMLKAREK